MSRTTSVRVTDNYDTTADAKRRISLRHTKYKYFHVKVFSNGNYLLEPRILAPLGAMSPRTLKMLDSSATNLNKERASVPVKLTGHRFPSRALSELVRVKSAATDSTNIISEDRDRA